MKETILSIMQWHAETFPDCTLDGQLEKYQEEQNEWVQSGEKDLSELADMFIVACGIARFDIHEGVYYISDVYEWVNGDVQLSMPQLIAEVERKMEINRNRSWEKRDGLYKHKGGK